MTREDRLKAGWVECLGVYCPDVGWYWDEGSGGMNGWMPKPKKRKTFVSLILAKTFCCGQRDDLTYPRRFWRRRKPKSPPPLQVGDEVVVRGRVIHVASEPRMEMSHQVRLDGAECALWFPVKNIERCKP